MNVEYVTRFPNAPASVGVFLSSPGDLESERNVLEGVVLDTASLFRRFGLNVYAWRYEREVSPGIGGDSQQLVNRRTPDDYDIFVGAMCRRVGTPTPRAPSGTIEEFLSARTRFERTGKPRVLFYFGSDPEPPRTSEEKRNLRDVGQFRRRYPGLFSSFKDAADLRYRFQRHLIDQVLDLCFASPEPLDLDRSRKGITVVSTKIDALSGRTKSYLDLSARRPERILRKLSDLVDLDRLLSQDEREVLTAAAFVRALRRHKSYSEEPHWAAFGRIADRIQRTVSLLENASQAQGTFPKPTEVRCEFVAALLRIGEALDLDHASIASPDVAPPDPNATLSEWLAYLTTEIEVESRGVITYHLAVPSAKWVEPLKLSTAARFELLWLEQQQVLARNRVAMAVAPCSVVIRDGGTPPPPPVYQRLRSLGTRLRRRLPSVVHLGLGVSPPPVSVEALLPLPESAVISPLIFHFQSDVPQKLVVRPNSGEVDNRSIEYDILPGTGALAVSLPESLEAVLYRWTLYRVYDPELLSPSALGCIRTLSARESALWTVWKGRVNEHDWAPVQIELDLRNDLLAALWPSLLDGSAPLEQKLLAHRFIHSAYEWIRLNAPRSSQLELYSRASGWLKDLIDVSV
jgi:hypothetical protein